MDRWPSSIASSTLKSLRPTQWTFCLGGCVCIPTAPLTQPHRCAVQLAEKAAWRCACSAWPLGPPKPPLPTPTHAHTDTHKRLTSDTPDPAHHRRRGCPSPQRTPCHPCAGRQSRRSTALGHCGPTQPPWCPGAVQRCEGEKGMHNGMLCMGSVQAYVMYCVLCVVFSPLTPPPPTPAPCAPWIGPFHGMRTWCWRAASTQRAQ
jgi:hypothetical protein